MHSLSVDITGQLTEIEKKNIASSSATKPMRASTMMPLDDRRGQVKNVLLTHKEPVNEREKLLAASYKLQASVLRQSPFLK